MSTPRSPNPVRVEDVARKVFGDRHEAIARWCVSREKPDKYNAIPKGRVANVYVIVEPLSRLIIRHEQETTDVTTIPTYFGYSVPAILNTKLQSGAMRRQMLALLHEWFDRNGSTYLSELKKLGYSADNYTCVMRPYIRREKRGREGEREALEEAFEGYCGECPNCLIFGYTSLGGDEYNVKSRVEGDLYVGVVRKEKAVITVTFNAVDDLTKTTYRPEVGGEAARTGALYTFSMVEVGTPFVGKLVLKDVTLSELLLTLITLARTSRVGGRQTHFGEVRIHIPAILFGKYELGSGYELAHNVLSAHGGERVGVEEVIKQVVDYANKFSNQGVLIVDRELADKLRSLSGAEVDAVVLQAWKDVLVFKKSLDLLVGKKG